MKVKWGRNEMPLPTNIPNTIKVVALDDPVVEANGFSPCGTYVDWCFGPIVGPSALAAYRRLGSLVETGGECSIDLTELAALLGLKVKVLVHTLARMERYGMASWTGTAFAVRRKMPPLPAHLARQLPAGAYAVHRRHTQAPGPRTPTPRPLRAPADESAPATDPQDNRATRR